MDDIEGKRLDLGNKESLKKVGERARFGGKLGFRGEKIAEEMNNFEYLKNNYYKAREFLKGEGAVVNKMAGNVDGFGF